MHTRKDRWILPLLTLVFIVTVGWFAFYNDDKVSDHQPSTYNTGREGMRVALQLLRMEKIPVERFETPYTHLTSQIGTLFVAEPFVKALSSSEANSLAKWVHAGGVLIVLKSADTIPGYGIGLSELHAYTTTKSTRDVPPTILSNSVFKGVKKVYYSGDCALKNYTPQKVHTLLKYHKEYYMLEWESDKGKVFAISDGVGLRNDAINKADNALLLVNLAQSCPPNREIDFDEYHQGYGVIGSGRYSLWQAIGAPARTLFWYGLIVLLLYIINANRRFGPIAELEKPEERNITDYVASIASLYQRAKAAEIPVETLYHTLMQTARERFGADPEFTMESIVHTGSQQGYWEEYAMLTLMTRCRKIADGDKANEQEMLQLTKSLDEYMNRLERGTDG